MPDRIANIVILVEDVEQQNLVFRYLERCNPRISYRDCRFETAATRSGGSGEHFVRKRYPVEVKEQRRRVGKGASALLAVMLDADTETTQWRTAQLADALQAVGTYARGNDEPIIVLIPKRHVETWIRALLGEHADELTDYTKAPFLPPTSNDIKTAAAELYGWTRPGASAGVTSPPSLTASLPEWQKIPS